jgi:hypothetical protein
MSASTNGAFLARRCSECTLSAQTACACLSEGKVLSEAVIEVIDGLLFPTLDSATAAAPNLYREIARLVNLECSGPPLLPSLVSGGRQHASVSLSSPSLASSALGGAAPAASQRAHA